MIQSTIKHHFKIRQTWVKPQRHIYTHQLCEKVYILVGQSLCWDILSFAMTCPWTMVPFPADCNVLIHKDSFQILPFSMKTALICPTLININLPKCSLSILPILLLCYLDQLFIVTMSVSVTRLWVSWGQAVCFCHP